MKLITYSRLTRDQARKLLKLINYDKITNYLIKRQGERYIIMRNIKGYNLGQKVGDKLTKLSKTAFSMECFTAAALEFFIKKRQNLAFGWTARYLPSNPSISGICLKFPHFVISLFRHKSFGNS